MSARNDSFVVERSLPNERLDSFLREQFPAVSRGAIQRLIEEGHITVNGEKVKATHAPRAGERIDVYWPEARPAQAQPEDIPLDVLYEDKDLLVINKPAGMVVHPAAGNEEHTLVNALLHHCRGKLSGIGGVARPGIVHRLDKDTSGCLVVAKNDAAHIALSTQFAERTLDKLYVAIVCGNLPHKSGEIRAAVARHPSHRKRMAVTEDAGRDAWTSYRVLQQLNNATFVEATLHTGRTHQIRVHFQHIGFPVAGDETYSARQNRKLIDLTGITPPRLMLHAQQIEFVHPRTHRRRKFEAPLPADFQATLEALRQGGGATTPPASRLKRPRCP
jgi:23S rRNA pseudouridine1911/1915/1917 synthase